MGEMFSLDRIPLSWAVLRVGDIIVLEFLHPPLKPLNISRGLCRWSPLLASWKVKTCCLSGSFPASEESDCSSANSERKGVNYADTCLIFMFTYQRGAYFASVDQYTAYTAVIMCLYFPHPFILCFGSFLHPWLNTRIMGTSEHFPSIPCSGLCASHNPFLSGFWGPCSLSVGEVM